MLLLRSLRMLKLLHCAGTRHTGRRRRAGVAARPWVTQSGAGRAKVGQKSAQVLLLLLVNMLSICCCCPCCCWMLSLLVGWMLASRTWPAALVGGFGWMALAPHRPAFRGRSSSHGHHNAHRREAQRQGQGQGQGQHMPEGHRGAHNACFASHRIAPRQGRIRSIHYSCGSAALPGFQTLLEFQLLQVQITGWLAMLKGDRPRLYIHGRRNGAEGRKCGKSSR